MDANEGARPQLSLHKGLRGRIEDVERQMHRLERERRWLDHMQAALAEIETQLRRMAALARESAGADEARREALSREFERCKRRVNLIAENSGPGGTHLLDDNLAAVRGAIAALDAMLREEFEQE